MSRVEFYRRPPAARVLDLLGAFPVNRSGVAASAVRTAVAVAGGGGVVGIFPEGGVRTGRDAAVRGGRVKRGVCLVAQRSGRLVVPVVVLGTDRLLRPGAYLPLRRSQVWVAFGDPIAPPPPAADGPSRRANRARTADEIEVACRGLHRRLLDAYGLDDGRFP